MQNGSPALNVTGRRVAVGFQVMAPPMHDDRLYRVGGALEAALADRWGHLLIDEAPDLVPASVEAAQ